MKGSTQAGAIGAAAVGTGAAVTAAVAGACCVGPALAPVYLAILGSSGLIAVSSLRPLTPWMLVVSGALLAFSFRQTYRRPACAAGDVVAPSPSSVRIARIVTWIAAFLWLASTAYAIYGLLNE